MELNKLIGREVNALYCSICKLFKLMQLGENDIICHVCGKDMEICNLEIKTFRE